MHQYGLHSLHCFATHLSASTHVSVITFFERAAEHNITFDVAWSAFQAYGSNQSS